jgi:twitching motility protein PilJ
MKFPLFGGSGHPPPEAAEPAGAAGAPSMTGTAHALGQSPRGGAGATSLEQEEAAVERSAALQLFGGQRTWLRVRLLGITALLALLVAVGSVLMYADRNGRVSGAIAIATEMQMLSQRIANSAQQAVAGSEAAFPQLAEAREQFGADIELLQTGGSRGPTLVAAAPEAGQSVLGELQQAWQGAERRVNLILALKPDLIALRRHEQTIEAAKSRLPGLAQELAVLATERREPTRVVTLAKQMQSDILNFDFANATQLVSTDNPNPQVALQLAVNVRNFRQSLAAVIDGRPETGVAPAADAEVRRKATQLSDAFGPFAASVEEIVKRMADLAEAKQASRELSKASDKLLTGPLALVGVYHGQASDYSGLLWTAVVAALIVLVSLAWLARVWIADARGRALAEKGANDRNQHAIVGLLDEIGGLSDGDLRVRAKVTEDFTGAIADAINASVEDMRRIVSAINRTTGEVTTATDRAQQISTELLKATEQQAGELREGGGTVTRMVGSIQEVSSRAGEAAHVAERSLAAAGKGSTAVRNTISGMNEIREQIQQTAKRIKRLGESSQEIGEIVGLISDITEQTNVLALNAAIQAKAAGDAGRGFSVVADEVQRLAQRSAEATKRIAAIVKNIQSDTQETVAAMEQTTQGVIEGARLSDAAGGALQEIENVSRELAGLAQSISRSTQSQVELADQLSGRMGNILDITTRTTKGTQETARSVAELAGLSTSLKTSVARFRV